MLKFYQNKDILLNVPIETTGQEPLSAAILRLSGTAAAGVTVTAAMLGMVQVNLDDGTEIVNASVADLFDWSDATYAFCEHTSAIGAAFAFTVAIPFRYPLNPYDTNALHRKITVQHSGVLVANVASGTCSLLGITSNSAPIYTPTLKTYTDTLRNTVYHIDQRNSIALMVRGAAALVAGGIYPSQMIFTRDGRIFQSGSMPELISGTDLICRSSGASMGLVLCSFLPDENFALLPSGRLSMQLSMTAGAAPTATYLVYSAYDLVSGKQPSIVPHTLSPTMAPVTKGVVAIPRGVAPRGVGQD